jgi:hypothetical protein
VSGLTDVQKAEITGEAYFLRALSYHNLVKFFGGVPLILTPITDANDAGKATRATSAEVYTQILSDLAQAQTLIANKTNTRQASVGAVFALRSRVLLYKGDYAGALQAAKSVDSLGYSLAPNFADLFSAQGNINTPEDIFRVGFTAVEFNELGYYYLAAGRVEVAPTPDLNAAYETGDIRKALTVGPRSRGRFEGVKYPTTIGAEHVHVIRYAEVVLTEAEAYARTGDLPNAVTQLNRIRTRAHAPLYTLNTAITGTHDVHILTTQAEVIDAIIKERRLELALEGDRFPDLVRTGKAVSVLGITQEKTLFPIPARETTTAPGITQNPGY